jgi:hypothetical protein
MYTGPTTGGVMPLDNSAWGAGECPLSATHNGYDGRTILGHVDDYWIAYGSTLPDPFITGGWIEHTYGDCTGDYMKTNQYNYSNTDGATTFYNYTSGAPLYWSDMEGLGIHTLDGGYGVKLFYESRGYAVSDMYNQYILDYASPVQGFTYDQYKAEIDAGRPVMIHVEGHTMVGFGYDDTTSNLMYIHDTWDYLDHTMIWGGSYSGMQHLGVTIVQLEELPSELEFGDAPEGSLAYPSSATPGAFPTCNNCGPVGWIQHNNFGAFFGPTFDFELDGNAGNCPKFPPYDADECFQDNDAGLIVPEPYTIQGGAVIPCPNSLTGTPLGTTCQMAEWGTHVDIHVTNNMPSQTTGFINVLMDWDQNGQWGGSSTCPGGSPAPEHVLVNFPVPNGYSGLLSNLFPPGFLIGPNPEHVWTRFTISEQQVTPYEWTGEGDFEDGETEDYLLLIEESPVGTIIVEKQTNPDGAPDNFTFIGDATGTISDGQKIVLGGLQPGTYTSTETVPVGWDLTSIVCDDSNSSGDVGTGTATFQLEAGETVTCTFTNTQQPGTIIVEKQTDPDGAPDNFTFIGHASGTISDGQKIVLGGLQPGTYTSTETVPAGWDLTSIVCGDSNSSGDVGTGTATFQLEAGETVTCTFTNTQQPGTIIVEKQTDPDGAPDNFTFIGHASGTISDGQKIVLGGLQPGTYTSTETVPAGWDLTSIVCDDSNSSGDVNTGTATFRLEAGETVTCTFTNVQVGPIPPDYFIYLPLIQNNSAVATAWSWGVSLPRSVIKR